MSIYFFSTTDKKIRALTGVKCIVFPVEDREKVSLNEESDSSEKQEIKKYIDERLKTSNAKEFSQKISEVLQDDENNKLIDFKEEYDHFNCITESVAGGFFHIRHLMCRIAFSSSNKNKISKHPICLNKAYEQVIKYYIDYSHFHYFAYPIIETYFALRVENNSKKEEMIYPERVEKYMNYLKGVNELSYKTVGKLIDEDYIFAIKYDKNDSYVLSQSSKINFKPKLIKAMILLYYDVYPLLKIKKIWYILVRTLFKNIKIVIPYLIGRLFPNWVKNKTGNLPSLISGDTQIDPVGFSSEKPFLYSSEVKLKIEEKEKNDLLWHILSRVSVIYQHKQFGWSKQKALTYFQMLREFFVDWQPRNEGSELATSELDFNIIESVYKLDNIKKKRLKHELGNLAINLFNEFSSIQLLDEKRLSNEERLPFYSFMNCSYYHI